MIRLRAIVFDSAHPAALARFWAEVLDGYAVRAYDETEIARLAKRGRAPETDPSVAVDGPGPTLWFQETSSAKTERNRVHLDVGGAPRSAEVARLCGLGATIRTVRKDHTVLLDPEGNEFCVVDV